MSTDGPLRDHLARLLDWGDAHVTYDEAVRDLPPGLRGARPQGSPHSPWELIEHLRITQRDILDFCRASPYRELRWPEQYWPAAPEPPDPNAWDRSIADFQANRDALKRIASDSDLDLLGVVPNGKTQTYLRELLLVADHGAYHLGQLILVRRLLGAWPVA